MATHAAAAAAAAPACRTRSPVPTPAKANAATRMSCCCTPVGTTPEATHDTASNGHARSAEAVVGRSERGAAGSGTATKSRTSRCPVPVTPESTTAVARVAETTAAATGARPEPAAGGSATEDTRATLVGGSE
jgi:hypothetical protein